MTRVNKLIHDERGMTYVFVGLGFLAFLAATMLAIDVGMLMTARAQAQNSADSGALAGAVALAFDDFNDRSEFGPASKNAVAASKANDVMGADVHITPADVEFPLDPEGQPTRVKVTVRRTAGTGNPVSTWVAAYFGRPTADIAATATAEAATANAMTCVKPFTIPDKWIENQTPPWDGDDTYDAFDNKGNPLANADVYIPADKPGYTGYNMEANRGQKLMIRAGSGNNITVSFYFSIAIGGLEGGLTGADAYRWNIANCNTSIMHWGDLLTSEPGDVMGPTIQGIEDLILRDPGAYWDTAKNKVQGSAYPGQSPRVFPIPLFDPIYYDEGKRNGRNADLKVANWIGFFVEEVQSNNIWGRIIPIGGIRDATTDAPGNLFPRAIRLVQ